MKTVGCHIKGLKKVQLTIHPKVYNILKQTKRQSQLTINKIFMYLVVAHQDELKKISWLNRDEVLATIKEFVEGMETKGCHGGENEERNNI
ncbi:MAG: hypothetical protein QXE05_04810 [Nitrososphaeria archaeon]